MQTKLSHSVIGVLMLSAAVLPAVGAPQVGQQAPAFSEQDTKGKTWTHGDLAGKKVILEWTNHECPYVGKHYSTDNMQQLQRDAVDQGYLWLSVISSAPGKQGHVSAAEADALTRKCGAAPTAVLIDEDGDMGRAYQARTTPHMYLLDEDGTLLYLGGIDSIRSSNPADVAKADNYVRLAMEDLAKDRPVSQAVTRPYGCSVKY